MSEKPVALRLAENLENPWHGLMVSSRLLPGVDPLIVGGLRLIAAIELRRQHAKIERLTADNERLTADNERLREALDKSLTDEQIRQIAASIDRSMPLKSAKILFARRIEAALRREDV